MRLPTNLGLKLYLILFTIFATGSLISLAIPEGGTFTYYNIIIGLWDTARIWYILALLDAILSCVTFIPLFRRAFTLAPRWTRLFRCLFILRVATFFWGHNYEFLVVRAAFHGTPYIGGITLGVWLLFIYPSFREHHTYAFGPKK